MQALAGEGDALTIDDATFAGLNAALLARRYGHAVSWFVNGLNVERGLPYFPFQLSCMLDDSPREECSFAGKTWGLTTMVERRALRFQLKQTYMSISSHQEIDHLLQTFSRCVGVDPDHLDSALGTVTTAAGVELRNHGWDHLNPHVKPEVERLSEVQRNEEYLSFFRRAVTCIFAPPFGKFAGTASGAVNYMLLADRKASNLKQGNVINRRELRTDDPPQARAMRTRSFAPAAGMGESV